jgi:hypothetical protein
VGHMDEVDVSFYRAPVAGDGRFTEAAWQPMSASSMVFKTSVPRRGGIEWVRWFMGEDEATPLGCLARRARRPEAPATSGGSGDMAALAVGR